jgi:NADH:ubiquinone oxidoreductase subunit 6 (subunit J)
VPVLLIGALPQPITEAPLVILTYAVLVLMVASALASVVFRNTLSAIGTFAATMVLVALLYLTIAPFLLFAVQLLVFTTVSAALLIGLLRRTTGLDLQSTDDPFRRAWIVAAAVAAVLLAFVLVIVATTSWPLAVTANAGPGFGETLSKTYVVGLAVLVVIIASAALGSGLLLAAPTLPGPRGKSRDPDNIGSPRSPRR